MEHARSRKFRRRPGAVLTALLLAASLVTAGCGSGDEPEATDGPVTISWGWWSNTPEKDALYRKWLDGFEAANPNIKIKSEFLPWDAYWDKVKTTTAGGNAYDVVGLCSCFAASYFDNEVFADLKKMDGYADATKGAQPGPVGVFGWKDKQYAMPVGISVPLVGYNKDLFKAAGVATPDPSVPMTFDAFKEMAKKLTKVNAAGKVTQYALHPGSINFWESLIAMRGGSMYDNFVSPTKVTVNSPQGIAGLADYASLFTDKIVPPIDEQRENQWLNGDLDSLRTGKVAMARVGPWNFADIAAKSPNIGVFPLPKIGDSLVLYSGANGYAISGESEHPKEAWAFLKWMLKTENQVEFAKFSDVPVDVEALKKLPEFITPKDFAPTLLASVPAFRPGLLTVKEELGKDVGLIIDDLGRGKLTPEQAAGEIEKKGNALLTQ
ncbi:sugar ABC transporter substrate-binding protein [Catellatospora methionotrophica]|uniref:Sugar ABC transporter substrate-binding protein n=1 Tax=Catellatospora methionotrophica TaxID=121620 RepID=A0A8J3LID5_9ACTN|nr:sugar ABC transporter substrate-binding protein [Catellatospora methionotrophica]GIG18785.1 sugar ABC transporter substrate-binding protein [Catellatospora methionotrophica]